MKNQIELRPSYWASVSGGKDSLYMLDLILTNRDKYPLDGVVHFELEIDYPFIKDVVNTMETACYLNGVTFLRIKPRVSWYDLYDKYGFPTRKARWCNSKYKLDSLQQLKEYMKTLGKNVVSYIGYCVDERERFEKRKNGDNITEIYPLADFAIEEKTILEWAKNEPIFNDYYKYNDRCGCMFCPLSSRKNYAYLAKYYPEQFDTMIKLMSRSEKVQSEILGRPFSVISSNPKYNADYLRDNIYNKWLPRLENEINKNNVFITDEITNGGY